MTRDVASAQLRLETRKRAVDEYVNSHSSSRQVARKHGISASTLGRWVRADRPDFERRRGWAPWNRDQLIVGIPACLLYTSPSPRD